LASLDPYIGNLDNRLAKHLLRRACFHYSKDALNEAIGKTAGEVIASISVERSVTWEWPYDVVQYNGSNPSCSSLADGNWLNIPDWHLSKYPCGQSRKRAMVAGWWWYNAFNRLNITDKLTWFLFTTFTISKDDGSGKSAHFFDYLNLVQYYSDKSVKDLAKKISYDAAMSYYLDNKDNNKNNPNENYAREFLELFTIGKGPQIAEGDYTNYTEHDVVMAAKVFSGIKPSFDRDRYDSDVVISPYYPNGIPAGYVSTYKHDPNDKTFSHAFDNQTISGGNNSDAARKEVNAFVDMVFDKQETAKNYVRKLYRMYVRSEWSDEVEQDIITPLALQLSQNGYNIIGVLKTLLESKHFFDLDDSDQTNENIGGMVKNPLQHVNELMMLLNISIPNAAATPPPLDEKLNKQEVFNFYRFWKQFVHDSCLKSSGMQIFAPNTVAGYAADYQAPLYDRAWFNSNTIIARYNLITSFIGNGTTYSDGLGNGIDLIIGKITNNNGNTYFKRIWTQFDTVTFVDTNFDSVHNPVTLINDIADLLYCEAIDDSRVAYFKSFLVNEGEPDYYWEYAWYDYKSSGDDTQVKLRLNQLIIKMINAAEFQLM
jgi:uncharacterized protein (DUF1800 family)